MNKFIILKLRMLGIYISFVALACVGAPAENLSPKVAAKEKGDFGSSAGRGKDTKSNIGSTVIVGEVVHLLGENVQGNKTRATREAVQSGTAGIGFLVVDADLVIVHGEVKFPGTNIRIQCERLKFEDEAQGSGGRGSLSTEPLSRVDKPAPVTAEGQVANAGTAGLSGGALTLYAGGIEVSADLKSRIILRGGQGQDAGEGRPGRKRGENAVPAGLPGNGGDGGWFWASANLKESGVLSGKKLNEFVDSEGGLPGKPGAFQKGGEKQNYWWWRPGQRRRPGADAPAPEGKPGVEGKREFGPLRSENREDAASEPSAHNLDPISEEMFGPIVEFLSGVRKEHPETCRRLAKQYLVRLYMHSQRFDSEAKKSFSESLYTFVWSVP